MSTWITAYLAVIKKKNFESTINKGVVQYDS